MTDHDEPAGATTVTDDGVELYFETAGPVTGEPLLLIAGQGVDHAMWTPVLGDFATRYRVITYDHRGTGQSGKPEEPPYTIERFALDACAVLDAVGAGRAHCYGVSMGGRIAQRLAISHPDRVGAVVLGATTPGNRHAVARPPEVDARMANRPTEFDEAVAFSLSILVSPSFAAANPDFVEAARRRFANPIPRYAQQLHYAASEGHEAWDELPSVVAPVLVVHGTEDEVNVAANGPLLAGRIPGAELHLIDGARHGYFVEFRAEASEIVLDFLARHPLARGAVQP